MLLVNFSDIVCSTSVMHLTWEHVVVLYWGKLERHLMLVSMYHQMVLCGESLFFLKSKINYAFYLIMECRCKCVFMLKLNPLLQKKDLFWGAVFVYLTPKHLQCYLQLKFPSSGIFSFSLVHKLITLFSGLLNVDLILHTHTHSQNVMLLLSWHSHLRTARSVAHERPFLVWVHHSCHLFINYRKNPYTQIHTHAHTGKT